MKIRRTRNTQQIITVSTILVVVVGYLGIAWFNHYPPFSLSNSTHRPGDYFTNMNRTEAEIAASNTLKDNPPGKTENNQTDIPTVPPTDSSTDKQTANVLLTNVSIVGGKVSASGFVSNLTESGGACMYVFRKETNEVRKVSDILTNTTSITCRTVSFPISELHESGAWKVTLEYTSSTASGISSEKEVIVP